MIKVLAEQHPIKIKGQWRTLKAVLVRSVGGKRVEYLDENGFTVHQEPLCRTPFKSEKVE